MDVNDYLIKQKKFKRISYKGQVVNEDEDGIGIMEWDSTSKFANQKYFGFFERGYKNLFGKFEYTDTKYYIGFLLFNTLNNFGILSIDNKIKFGLFCNDVLIQEITFKDNQQFNLLKQKFNSILDQMQLYYQNLSQIGENLIHDTELCLYVSHERNIIINTISDLNQELRTRYQHLYLKYQKTNSKAAYMFSKKTYYNKHIYQGQQLGQKSCGIGLYQKKVDSLYIGWFDLLKNGFGKYTKQNIQYLGFFKDGKKNDLMFCVDQLKLEKDSPYNQTLMLYQQNSVKVLQQLLNKQQIFQLYQILVNFQQRVQSYSFTQYCNAISNQTQIEDKQLQKITQQRNKINSNKIQFKAQQYLKQLYYDNMNSKTCQMQSIK